MKIALDYDGTITADPVLWQRFARFAKTMGHDVFVVTYRSPTLDRTPLLDAWEEGGFKVWYTNGIAKRFWCEHFGPGSVDIWVDDRPQTVFENSKLSKEQLEEWRAEQFAEGANPNN